MKITRVEPILLSYEYKPEEQWGWSGGSVQVWHTALVRVHTDEGIVGVGEMGTGHYIPEAAKAVCEFLEKTLIGQDPFQIDVLFSRMYKLGANWGRRGIAMGVISGIENALWDLKGKALGVPVWSLLGGQYRKSVRAYASGGMEQPIPSLIAEVEGYLKRGFTAVKIRGGYDAKRDVEKVKALRDALGYDFDLALDCGQGYVPFAWSAKEAEQVCDALEPYKLFFIEEPCRTDELDVYAQVRASSKTPIAGGENGCSIYEYKQLIDKKCVDIIQPDVTHAGGIGEVKRAAEYAYLNGITVAPHVFRSGASVAAHLHLLSAIPNALICEYQQIANPLREELLLEPLTLDENGALKVPTAPGLGIELTQATIDRYPYKPGTEQRFKVEDK